MSNSPYHIVNAATGKHIGPFSTETDAALAKSITYDPDNGWRNGKVLGRNEFDTHLFGGVEKQSLKDQAEEIAGGESGSPPNLFADAVDIDQVIMLAIGAASVCWENPSGAGEFDSSRAVDIGKDASVRIHELIREFNG